MPCQGTDIHSNSWKSWRAFLDLSPLQLSNELSSQCNKGNFSFGTIKLYFPFTSNLMGTYSLIRFPPTNDLITVCLKPHINRVMCVPQLVAANWVCVVLPLCRASCIVIMFQLQSQQLSAARSRPADSDGEVKLISAHRYYKDGACSRGLVHLRAHYFPSQAQFPLQQPPVPL